MFHNTILSGSSFPSSNWQVVLRQPSGRVVLYNPHSNQLSIQSSLPKNFAPVEQSQDNHHGSQESQSDDITDEPSQTLQLSPPRSNELLVYGHQSYCPLCLQPLNLPAENRTKPGSAPSSEPVHRTSTPVPLLSRSYRRALPPPSHTLPKEGSSSLNGNFSSRTITQKSYFGLLSRTSTPLSSRAITPPSQTSNFIPISPSTSPNSDSRQSSIENIPHLMPHEELEEPLGDEKRVDGYYERFFVEEMKLGRGQKGSVFLCTHVLDGNALGHYAVKKIAIGQSSPELLHVLREVKCLETLRHRNITQYHHAWIEKAQLSRFGPRVPVLYILMDYANGGSLDHYISLRKGTQSPRPRSSSIPRSMQEKDEDAERRKTEKALFRKKKNTHTARARQIYQTASDETLTAWSNVQISSNGLLPETPTSRWNPSVDMAVHLFGLEEILNVFEDTCRGLGFLHSKGILHHDLKTENVLLHWESEDSMIPTALISDFGSSVAQSENWRRERTGRTGTLDWVPPESLKKDPRTGRLYEVTQKGDMWQLGLVLHFLCFFRLPYTESDDIDKLEDEIKHYPGFLLRNLPENVSGAFPRDDRKLTRSDLPNSILQLLSNLLCLDPSLRPSCDTVLNLIASIRHSNTTPRIRKPFTGTWKNPVNSILPRDNSSSLKRPTVSENHEPRSRTYPHAALIKRKKIFDASLSSNDSHLPERSIAPATVSSSVSGSHPMSLSPSTPIGQSAKQDFSSTQNSLSVQKWREDGPQTYGKILPRLPAPPTDVSSYLTCTSPSGRSTAICFALGIALKVCLTSKTLAL